MKYVRTKNNIYEICPTLVLWPSSIVKQSDDIEELFNCFVDHDCEYDTFLVTNDSMCRHNHEIYGAIWTKWGLKYVAKMNDKGEWELLEEKR